MNEFDYLKKVETKLNNEKFVEAISLCNKALMINPELSDAYNLRGNANYELGYYDAAIEDYTQAIKIEPTEDKYMDRGYCYLDMDIPTQAIFDFTSAIKIMPDSFLAYYGRGYARMVIEEYQDAVQDFKTALEICPDLTDALIQLGYARLALGRKDAMKYFNKAVKLSPSAETYLERVRARGKILFRENALKNLTSNKAVQPKGMDINIYNKKQAKDDIKDLTKGLELEPNNILLLEERANRYYYLKDSAKTLEDCTKLIELDSEKQYYYYLRAIVEYRSGKYQDAINDCYKYLEFDYNEDYAEVLFLKATAEYKLKQYDEVIKDTSHSLCIEKSCGGFYYKGLACYQLGKFKKAYYNISRAIDFKPDILESNNFNDKLPKPLKIAIKLFRKDKKTNSNKFPIGLRGIAKEQD